MSWLNPNSDLKKQFNEFYADVEIVLGGIYQDLEKIKTEYDQRISYLSELSGYLNDSDKLNQINLLLKQSEENKKLFDDTLMNIEKSQSKNEVILNYKFDEIDTQINEIKLKLDQFVLYNNKFEINIKDIKSSINTIITDLDNIKKDLYTKLERNKELIQKDLLNYNQAIDNRIKNIELEYTKKINMLKYIIFIISAILLVSFFI